MADIKNKNELKRRIEFFMDELDYSINEEFCKETMMMMRDFIGRASHLLDCADVKIKKAKKTARNKAIDEFAENIKDKSSDILFWLMKRQEEGYGTSNGELHDKWLSKIDEIAEQMKVGATDEC